MNTSALDYTLPDELIATRPAEPRESARLMVVRRSDAGTEPEHARIADLPGLLKPRDLLVVNDTRVAPALLRGEVDPTGAAADGLWIAEVRGKPLAWRVMIKTRRARAGKRIRLHRRDGTTSDIVLELLERLEDDAGGVWVAAVHKGDGPAETRALLAEVGSTPLPPYIRKAREARGEDPGATADASWSQTAYARMAGDGDAGASVAAPTAGLHLTAPLLAQIEAAGVDRAAVRLDVGIGTFRPVTADRLEDHQMHSEWCTMPATAHEAVFSESRRRVVAVGSTSARTIEAYARELAAGRSPESLETDLMMAPGSDWMRVDGMLTNFHLPKSTLLAMVGSMLDGGIERLIGLYREAVDRGYRFYSYCDAMLLLP